MGLELRRTHNRLVELRCLVDEVYGPESPVCAAFTEAADIVWRLLQQMQTQADADCPGRHAADFYR